MQEDPMDFMPWGQGAQLCGGDREDPLRRPDARRLAVMTAFASVGMPVEIQKKLERRLDTVRDPRVLHTMAVLARDLTNDDRLSTPSELFVSHVLGRETPDGQQANQSDRAGKLQRHLEGLRRADWWTLAPLLRIRLRRPIRDHFWWICLLLTAIDAPALGILRKREALVLAKWLLVFAPSQPREANCVRYEYCDVKREMTTLLGAVGRAHGFDEPTRAVLRVVAFTTSRVEPDPFLTIPDPPIPDLKLLRLLLPGHCHVPPPCSPMFEPLAADLPASSELVVLLVDFLARLGTDALSLTLLRRMRLRDKRAAACSCRGLRALIAPHLRSATLHVLAEDATPDNGAFVARLPTLERLHVEGESFLSDGLDIPKLRSLPRLALKTIGAPAALFLGYLLSGGDHIIRLSNGSSCISLQPVATRNSLRLVVASAADLAVILGSLSNNRALKRLELPLIFNDWHSRRFTTLAAAEALGEMVVPLGQAIRYVDTVYPGIGPTGVYCG